MAQCLPDELLESARCFACLGEKSLQVVIASLLCQIIQASNPMASCDAATLLNDGRCFACLSTQQMMMIQTQLLCEVLNGGGTGATCLICGDSPPVDPAPCDCSIYYTKSPNAGVWIWSGSAWEAIIAPGP